MKFRIFSSFCFATGTLLASNPNINKPLNVIYLLADDMGYGELGCYGQKIIPTPNIDALASKGILFTQHYAGSTVSAPSRCVLMTGLHTGHAQIRKNIEIQPEGQQPMAENTFTLGKLFQNAGYKTGLFGKWGLGYPGSHSTPVKMGFDEFYGNICQRISHTYYPEHVWHNEQKVLYPDNFNSGRKTYVADSIHNYAMNFIRSNSDKPFFAMLTYMIPHAEINVPHDEIYDRFEDLFKEKPYLQGNKSYPDSKKPKQSYVAMIVRLDNYVGEIVSELKRLGIEENTLIIFTSDNGPAKEGGAEPQFFNSVGPLRGLKRDLYEGGIRVPMIAYCPALIKEGQKTDHISAFWDVMPTFAEITNQKLPVKTDGISFLPTLIGKVKQKQHPYLYWEFHEQGGKVAVRMGKWKAVKLNNNDKSNNTIELYDLSNDLGEEINVASENPRVVRKIRNIMLKARTEL